MTVYKPYKRTLDGKEEIKFPASVIDGCVPAYVVGTGTAGVWAGTIDGLTEYYHGLVVLYRTPAAGASTTTLNINGLGAKTIYRYSTAKLTTHYSVNSVIPLVYDSTLNNGCWIVNADYDSTDTYSIRPYYARFYAGANAIYGYKLCAEDAFGKILPLSLEDSTGASKTVQTAGFRPERLFYYNSTGTVAAGAAIGHGYLYLSALMTSCAYTFNSTIATYKHVYLKGTYNKGTGLFTLDNTNATSWYVQVPADTSYTMSDYFDNAHQYIHLGTSHSSANYMYLYPTHQIYVFNGSSLIPYIAPTTWGDVTGKPSTFAPSEHSHAQYLTSHQDISGKVNKSDIVNALNSTTTDAPLSAYQGKVLNDAISAINTLLGSDNVNLDTLQEVVDYIENHESVLAGITTSKVNVSAIADNLITTDATRVLSAKQGYVLKGLIGSHTHSGYAQINDSNEFLATQYIKGIYHDSKFGVVCSTPNINSPECVAEIKYWQEGSSEKILARIRDYLRLDVYAPSDAANTEITTAKFHTANGGSIRLGKEGANSGTMIRLDQADGTCRLRFRASSAASAMVWEQPEANAALYMDLANSAGTNVRLSFNASGISAPSFTEGGTLLSSKYAPISHPHAKSDVGLGNVANVLQYSASNLPPKMKGVDTRSDNQAPSWYMSTHGSASIVTEFKNCATIGANSVFASTYCQLTTFTSWSDASGGLPVQIATASSGGGVAIRYAMNNTDAWMPWSALSLNGHTHEQYLTAHQDISGKLTGTKFSSSASFNTYIPYTESTGGNQSPQYVASFINNNGAQGLTYSPVSALPISDAVQAALEGKASNGHSHSSFNSEVQFTHATYCPTWSDIASGIGKSSCFTRGAFMQAITGQIIAANTAYSDSSKGYNTEAGKIKFQSMTASNGQPVVTDLAVLDSTGLKVGGTKVSLEGHTHAIPNATSSAVGGVKMRVASGILYIRNDGTNA